MTKESDRAKTWRESHDLSREELGKLIGYSAQSIQLFELGHTPPRSYKVTKRALARRKAGPRSRDIAPEVWTRYKAACAGIDAYLNGRRFDW